MSRSFAVSFWSGIERVGEGVVALLGLDDSLYQDVLDNMTDRELDNAAAVHRERQQEYEQHMGNLHLQATQDEETGDIVLNSTTPTATAVDLQDDDDHHFNSAVMVTLPSVEKPDDDSNNTTNIVNATNNNNNNNNSSSYLAVLNNTHSVDSHVDIISASLPEMSVDEVVVAMEVL
jgi:hypothetical protein